MRSRVVLPVGLPWSLAAEVGGKLSFDLDVEVGGSITQSGGLVSSWVDGIGSAAFVQATGANKPTYSATGFRGLRPAISFDGLTQHLVCSPTPPGLPVGASYAEVWMLLDCKRLAADTAIEVQFGWGTNVTTSTRHLRRLVLSGVSRARSMVSDGATGINATNSAVVYEGPRIARWVVSPTATRVDVNGTAGTSANVVPSMTAGKAVIGASPATVPANPAKIDANRILGFNAALTATEVAAVLNELNRRL